MTTDRPGAVSLPPVSLFRQFCSHANGWSDHYGALHTAAAYAGTAMPERYFIKAIWMHGCGGPWLATIPSTLYLNSPMATHWPVFVARAEEVVCLQAHGLPRVRAIGLPIAYAPTLGAPRTPGSLLVMPTHTLVGDSFPDRRAFERYADEISALKTKFQRVVVCIHPNCQKNGLWVQEFTSRGFDILYGAQTNDLNALTRMRALFEQFEFVTTNGWGGHVAYALAFGARVSIYGTQPSRAEADLARDESWAAARGNLKTLLSSEMRASERAYLEDFYRAPEDGLADLARGRWLIGADSMLSPGDMRELLGAMVDPTPLALAPAVLASTSADRTSNARRRILFVSHEATRTGAPTFLLHFLRWLRRETTLDFEVLLGKGGPLDSEFLAVANVYTAQDFAENPSLLQSFDLIYSNTACNSQLIEDLPYGEIPVITHFHELDMAYHWLGARKLAAIFRHSDHLVACAQAVADRLQEVFQIPTARLSVHHEMIDAAVLSANVSAASATLRRDFGVPDNAVLIVGCGTLEPRKGPDLFVQLALELKRKLGGSRPLRCLWVGALKSSELLGALTQDLRKLGLQQEVKFVGELPSPHGILASSDVFCLTSREDPFPLTMLEAAALARPVVCFDGAGGAREFCAAGGGIAVPYLDVAAMATVCHELLQDPARASALGQGAAELVQRRFTVDAIAPALWKEIQQHLSAPVPGYASRPRAQSAADVFATWRAEEAPQSAYVSACVARSRSRKQARAFLRDGKKRDAIQSLVKAVSADLASRDPVIMQEGLFEISQDLAPLEAQQSARLLAEADRIVQISPHLRHEMVRPKTLAKTG